MIWQHHDGFIYHAQNIGDKINGIVDNDPTRRFTQEQKAQIATIKLQDFDDFMSDLAMDQAGRPSRRGPLPQSRNKL